MGMTLGHAELDSLVASVGDADDGHPYPYYSGRGMIDRTCFGWVADQFPVLVFLELARVHAKRCRANQANPAEEDFDDAVYEIGESMTQIGSPRTDSLGTQTIFYWPGVRVEVGAVDSQEG